MESETALPDAFLQMTRPATAEADLGSLVSAHKQMVYRIAYSVLRNHHDAEDAAQEAFLKAFRASGKLSEVRSPKAWMARIAWNAALDCRRQRPAPGVASHDSEQLEQGVMRLRHAGRTPEEIASGSEMQRLLAQLIQALPANLREAVTLSSVEDLDYSEIAETLGITEAAVRARLHQARRQLKEKLDRVLGDRL